MRFALPTALLSSLVLAACSSNGAEIDEEKQLELYMTTATYLYQDDSLLRAQDQAVKALDLDPGNIPMRRMIGWIRVRLGTTEDLIIAEQILRELYDEGDRDTPTVLGLATAQERLALAHDRASRSIRSGERFTESADPTERADELAEDAAELFEEAYENYSAVLTGNTQRDKALNGLQRISALRGEYEESLAWGRQLLEVCKEDIDFWRDALDNQDLTETNERVFNDSIRTATAIQVDTLLLSTDVLHRLGRTGDALASLEAAVSINPDRPELYSQRAQLLNEVGRYEEAISDVDRFLAISDQPYEHPDVRRAYDLRARCEEGVALQAAVQSGLVGDGDIE